MFLENAYNKYEASPIGVAHRSSVEVCSGLGAGFGFAKNATTAQKILGKAGGALGLPSVAGAPLAGYDFVKQCRVLASKDADRDDKVAAVGSLLEDVGTVANSVESLTRFLTAFDIIPAQAFLPPLQIACGLFSAVTLGFEAKALADLVKFSRHLDITRVSDRALTRLLGSGERSQVEKLTKEQLKGRVKQRIVSRALAITASIIAILAAICLLISPLSFLALGLTAVGAGIGFAKIVYDKVSDDKWKKLLKSTAPPQ